MTTAQKPIHTLLVELATKVGTIRKEGTNTQFNYNFRGVDQVVNAVHPVLTNLGIALTSEVISYSQTPGAPTSSGKPSTVSLVHMRYTFTGPKGDQLTADGVGENLDYQDKGMAGAQSVAFRVMWLQVTTSPTDDRDPDLGKVEPDSPAFEGPAMKNENGVKAMVAQAIDGQATALKKWWASSGKPLFDSAAPNEAGLIDLEQAEAIVVEAKAYFEAPFEADDTAQPGTSEEDN